MSRHSVGFDQPTEQFHVGRCDGQHQHSSQQDTTYPAPHQSWPSWRSWLISSYDCQSFKRHRLLGPLGIQPRGRQLAVLPSSYKEQAVPTSSIQCRPHSVTHFQPAPASLLTWDIRARSHQDSCPIQPRGVFGEPAKSNPSSHLGSCNLGMDKGAYWGKRHHVTPRTPKAPRWWSKFNDSKGKRIGEARAAGLANSRPSDSSNQQT